MQNEATKQTPKVTHLCVGHINIRSLRNKVHEVAELLSTNQMARALSETWLNSSDNDEDLAIDGYYLFQQDCPDRGGGVCIYVLDSIPARIDMQFSRPDIELLCIRIHLQKHRAGLLVGCLYRPPSADASFWTRLEATLEGAEGEEVIMLGDLNVNFLLPESSLFYHLNHAMMLPLRLTNFITEATQFSKNGQASLDVVLTNSDKLHSGSVKDSDLSDHCLVIATLDCVDSLVKTTYPKCFRRDFRQFDPDAFQQLLQNANLSQFGSSDVDQMWSGWCGKFLEALDKVAPLKCCSPRKNKCLFMSPELLDLIHRRKAAYRKVRAFKFQDESLLQQFRCLRSQANNLYRHLRNCYFYAACQSYHNRPRLLWAVINC